MAASEAAAYRSVRRMAAAGGSTRGAAPSAGDYGSMGGDTHITERSVDTLVKRLRKKIEDDPAEPRYISTVWGTGYKFIDA